MGAKNRGEKGKEKTKERKKERKMNSNKATTRVLGQYTIASLFLSRSSDSSKEVKEDLVNEDSKKLASLSDFLNQMLPRSSGIPKTVQEKSRPFSSVLCANGVKFIDKQNKSEKKEKKDGLDKVVLRQFKQESSEKVDSILSSGGVGEEDKEENTRKRRNPFEGVDEKRRKRKPFLVLGDEDDSQKSTKRGSVECSTSNKEPKPHYNHYANGGGWWDSEMEGVDSEEVGYGEVWEGVGSTTFGGIVDWH